MLSPPGIIEAARAMAASLSRCLEIKYRAASDRETSDAPKIATKGRNASQVATGISCNAFQAVQRASIVPQFPFSAGAAPAIKITAGQKRNRPWKPPSQMHDQELIGGHPEEIVCLIGKSAQMTKPLRADLIMKIPGEMPLHPDVPWRDDQNEDRKIFPSQQAAKS